MCTSLPSSGSSQRGFNLVELMVAMLLGLVLVGGAGKIFLSNTQAFRLQENVSGMQESSRLAMEMLLADLRRAGLDMDKSTLVTDGVTGQNGSATTAAVAGLLANSDEVRVAYVAPVNMTDCEGNPANAGQTVVNRYFIRLDTDPAIPALFCSGAVGALPTSAGTALLRGVESFQLTYGVAAAGSQGNGYSSPARYVTAGTVGGEALVGAVQVALLVRTETGIQGVQPPVNNMRMLDVVINSADLAAVRINGLTPVHRLFVGTAAIRNAAIGNL